MTDQALTDEERQLLVVLVTQAWTRIKDYADPIDRDNAAECEAILRKLSGVDKQVVVRTLKG